MASASNLDYIGIGNGLCLSLDQRSAIQCSRPLLAREHKGDPRFWGKVTGLKDDYLLMEVVTSKDTQPPADPPSGEGEDAPEPPQAPSGNKFLFSVDEGMSWEPLPPVNQEQQTYCELIRGPFKGVPNHEYRYEEEIPPEPEEVPEETTGVEGDGEEAQEEDEEDGEEEEQKEDDEADEGNGQGDEEEEEKEEKKPKKNIKVIQFPETVRLAQIVNEIDDSCRIIVKDLHKGGLPVSEAYNLDNYLHDRSGSSGEEPLSGDVPKGIWSIKRDPVHDLATGLNWLFPGYTFYHAPTTLKFGQYYIGNGLRNYDLPFHL